MPSMPSKSNGKVPSGWISLQGDVTHCVSADAAVLERGTSNMPSARFIHMTHTEIFNRIIGIAHL